MIEMDKKQKEKEKFQLEEALKEVEAIIGKLEANDVSLKDSIALYGEGAKLLSACKEELSGIEKEMIIIQEGMEEA